MMLWTRASADQRPVERYLRSFATDAAEPQADGKPILKKPAHPITVRELMTHTSGMVGEPPASTGPLMVKLDLMTLAAPYRYTRASHCSSSGHAWMYSTVGIDVLAHHRGGLGHEVRRVPGEADLRAAGDGGFVHLSAGVETGAPGGVYTIVNGRMVKAGADILGGDALSTDRGRCTPGLALRLYSTAGDLVKFYQMMLNKGVYHGKRLLSATRWRRCRWCNGRHQGGLGRRTGFA